MEFLCPKRYECIRFKNLRFLLNVWWVYSSFLFFLSRMISRTVSLLLIFWYVFVFFPTTCVSDLFAAFAMNRLNSWLVVIYDSCGMFPRFGSLCLHGGLQPENLHPFSRFAVVFAIELGIRLGPVILACHGNIARPVGSMFGHDSVMTKHLFCWKLGEVTFFNYWLWGW